MKISIQREWKEQNRLRISFERKLTRTLNATFKRIGDKAVRDSESGSLSAQFDQYIQENLMAIMRPHYIAVIEAFGQREQRRKFIADFDELAKQFIREQGAARVVNISNTTARRIRKAIKEGITEGLGQAEVAKNIRLLTEGVIARRRSRTIARTETHSAATYASHEVNKSFQIPNQQKQWVAAVDERTRQWHIDVDGKVVLADEDFIVRGVPMSYAGDPKGGAANVINCRCVTVYIDPEDDVIDASSEPEDQSPFKITPAASIVFRSPKEARERIESIVKEAAQDPRQVYELRYPSSVSARKVREGFADELDDITTQRLDACMDDVQKLCTLFNVPMLRGIQNRGRSKRAVMAMGNGVLDVYPHYMRHGDGEMFGDGNPVSEWSRRDGYTKEGRPRVTDDFFESGFETFRSTVIHETGHHVAESYKIDLDQVNANIRRGDFDKGYPVEDRIKRTRKREGPTKYSDKNAHEWFAENFSLYFTGKKELCSPKFIQIIEEMINDAYR